MYVVLCDPNSVLSDLNPLVLLWVFLLYQPLGKTGLHLRLGHYEQNIAHWSGLGVYWCPDYCHSGVLLQDISLCQGPRSTGVRWGTRAPQYF